MDFETRIIDWISSDPDRMEALEAVSTLHLDDWCIAAGFVRNLAWDKLHQRKPLTPLNDIDVIYYDPIHPDAEIDRSLERRLSAMAKYPWSVKNQARMHERNRDKAYTSTSDAMSYWVEMETAVGIRLSTRGEIEIIAPFGIESLFGNSITINSKRKKTTAFYARIKQKSWLSKWPNLEIST